MLGSSLDRAMSRVRVGHLLFLLSDPDDAVFLRHYPETVKKGEGLRPGRGRHQGKHDGQHGEGGRTHGQHPLSSFLRKLRTSRQRVSPDRLRSTMPARS